MNSLKRKIGSDRSINFNLSRHLGIGTDALRKTEIASSGSSWRSPDMHNEF